MTFSVVWRICFLRSFRHRGGGSAGAGSMPVAEAAITPSQAIVTANRAIGSAVSAGVPTWQPGHAITAPRAACPSQQGQGSPSMCAGFAEATTTAGKATHSTAATRASVDRIRVAKVITLQGYEGREALSGLSRSKSGHDCVTGMGSHRSISNIPEIRLTSRRRIPDCCHEARRCRRPPGSPGQSDPAEASTARWCGRAKRAWRSAAAGAARRRRLDALASSQGAGRRRPRHPDPRGHDADLPRQLRR